MERKKPYIKTGAVLLGLAVIGCLIIFAKPFNLNESGCTETCLKKFAGREQVIRDRAMQLQAENKALKIKIQQIEQLQQNETKCISRDVSEC